MTLRIDPEFKDYLGPLDAEARQALEESLMAEGCRDALVVWPQAEGDAILLDGHNRFDICERLGIACRTVNCPDSITDRNLAVAWIIENQRARRNLTKAQFTYLIGMAYKTAKAAQGGTGSNQYKVQSDQIDHSAQSGKTAERLADQFGVSAPTVRRAENVADEINAVAAGHGPEAKAAILSGRAKVSDYAPETGSVDAPTPAERELVRIRSLSDGEYTLEMARNAVFAPGHDCGATDKPIPLPGNASPNFADPEVLARGGDPFCFAVSEMERHALAARTALDINPPPGDMHSSLSQRLATLETAIRDLSGSLQGKE